MDKKLALKTTIFMSVFWSVFSAIYIAAVTFIQVPMGNERIVDQVLGFIMGTIVATAINFWLGSSWGSKSKEPENKKGVIDVTDPVETSTDESIG
jgi:uncharacterized membrane protein YwaF